MRVATRFAALGELSSFLWTNKKWWLAPVFVCLLILSVVIVLANSSAVVPWVFSLF